MVKLKPDVELKPDLKVIKPDEIHHLLEPGAFGAILELTVKDKAGNVTDHRVQKSESFVRGFMDMLWICFTATNFHNTPYILTTKDGTVVAAGIEHDIWSCDGGIGDENLGIMVGTGTTAPNISDYQLESRITHGAGAGQLSYSANAFGAPANDSTTAQCTITRDFANASGGAVTVNEVGLYVRCWRESVAQYVMILRDGISGGILVPNGQTLTVNYRPQCVV